MGKVTYERVRQWTASTRQRPVVTKGSTPVLSLQPDPAVALQRTISARSSEVGPANILALQRSVGNRAVRQLLANGAGQETGAATGSRFGTRDANGVAAGADIAVDRAGAKTGQALGNEVRSQFETSLGVDLSAVRIHTDRESAAAANAVGAKAYTVGQDIHFGAGYYAPGNPDGVHLLAHEVAHTVQNRHGPATQRNKLEVSTPGDAAEIEADRAADAIVARTPAAIHRDDDPASRTRTARISLTAAPNAIARDPLKTNGGSFKIDHYEENDTDKGKDTDKSVGANIEITFTPAESVTSNKVSFVQIMKVTNDGTPYLFENEKPRATDAKSGDAGWAVDRLAGRKSPNYGQENDGTAGGNTRFGNRKSKTEFTDAWMHDKINLPRSKGMKVVSDATTFALDNTGSKYLGGVTWGFTTDAAGKTVKKAEAIQSMGDPTGVQKSALEKWNEQAGLADASKRNAPDQEKVPVP
jgi:hypothetical protein